MHLRSKLISFIQMDTYIYGLYIYVYMNELKNRDVTLHNLFCSNGRVLSTLVTIDILYLICSNFCTS